MQPISKKIVEHDQELLRREGQDAVGTAVLEDNWQKKKKKSCFQIMFLKTINHKRNTRVYFLYPGFPGGSDSRDSACNAGDLGSIPGS